MAKRKRLTPASITSSPELETKAFPNGVAQYTRAPIAQVAGNAATHAALEEIVGEVQAARTEGRLVQALALEEVQEGHLLRDRIACDQAELDALKASLQARGQQAPIEVVELPEGGFGLISGFRRLRALSELLSETGEARFGQVQALIKPIGSVSDSYVAMVEENEIRAELSFYERARVACAATELGVFPTRSKAVQSLFSTASPAKRSKITAFMKLHDAWPAGTLKYPAAIPERLGLALVAAIDADPKYAARLKDALRKTPPETAADERAALERYLRKGAGPTKSKGTEIAPGIMLEARKGRVVLSGTGITETLRRDLEAWLSQWQ